MLHDKHVRYGQLSGDESEAGKRDKRRRKSLPQSSSSDAPAATAQGHQAPISYANDHQGPVTNLILQAYVALQSGEDEVEIKGLFGPEVILSPEDQASCVAKLPPDIDPPMCMAQMSWEDNYKLKERHGRLRIAYYKVHTVRVTTHFIFNPCHRVCICAKAANSVSLKLGMSEQFRLLFL